MYQNSELLVYKASAGSGKTFTLAVEYIKLLINNPRAYRNILAVTFTNKATTEMKERILGQLFGIATGDTGSDAYLKQICEDLQLTDEVIRKQAGRALSLLIHDYNRFRVETIDSFFQSVMRNLARELELGANLTITLNNDEVLSQAVDTMIEHLDRHSQLLTWLLEFIQERIAGDRRWNVSGEIKSFGHNIFNETYIERGDKLRQKLRDPQYILSYKNTLEKLKRQSQDLMTSLADQFFGIIESEGLQPEDLIRGKNGIMSYFVKLRNGNYDDSIRNSTVEKCLQSPNNWTSKTSRFRNQIISLAENQLTDLLRSCENFRPQANRTVRSCDLSLRYLNHLRLLTYIDKEVRILNQHENRFLLSDTNNLLRQLMQEGDSSFIFEKMGASIYHVMIDEFQDTSRMQWNNFQLLLLEGLSQGANSLIVGDVKQSIYRWRSGDWSILNNLQGKMAGIYPICEKTLDINRRSESRIIYFNNEIFTAGSQWLNSLYKEENGQDCYELMQAYKDVRQQSPRTTECGYVRIAFLPDDRDHNYVEDTLHQLGEQVDSLIKQGVKLSDITILVRKNKNIPIIADYFSQHLPYRIVSDEAFRLDASVCISALIDALRYLADNQNTIALARLASVYQKEVLHHEIDWNTLLLHDLTAYLPEEFMNESEDLRLMPLFELLEKLFSIFRLSELQEQDAYLFAFFDTVMEYLQEKSSDLDTFLHQWDDKLRSKTIPSGELDGIRIFSIHKSKGLEFHTVLIPFCDWNIESDVYNHLVWCTPEDAPFNQLDLIPVNYSSSMAQSTYANSYYRERLQLWVDNLNLLYVAFTRAGKNLIVWSNANKKNSISNLLYNALPSAASRLKLTFSEESLFEWGNICPSEETKTIRSTNPLTIPPESRPVRMESFQHRIDFRQSNRSADFIRGENAEEEQDHYIKQGRLLHYLFSIIHTEADVEPTLKQMELDGLLDSISSSANIRTLIERALSRKEARDWFSGEWELFNEHAILYMENHTLQTRRPDRVMIKDRQAVVVDFKFGKKNECHNEQVRAYMQLLNQMGYADIQGFVWYVFSNELVKVNF